MGKKNPGWEGKTTKKWSQELIDSLKLKSSDNIVMFNKPFDKGLVREIYKQRPFFKPDGVWYACGSEWLTWTFYEMESWLGDYIYRLDIDKSNFIMIRNEKMLFDFTEGYALNNAGYGVVKNNTIDWPLVAKAGYQGIQICPYLSMARMSSKAGWYYTWDVASGCVWDTSCIKNVSIIEF